MKQLALVLATLCACNPGFSQESDTKDQPAPGDRLAGILKRFPQSDANVKR